MKGELPKDLGKVETGVKVAPTSTPIQVTERRASPAPSPTPVPAATSSPVAVAQATPEPTATPAPTPKPSPKPTATPRTLPKELPAAVAETKPTPTATPDKVEEVRQKVFAKCNITDEQLRSFRQYDAQAEFFTRSCAPEWVTPRHRLIDAWRREANRRLGGRQKR